MTIQELQSNISKIKGAKIRIRKDKNDSLEMINHIVYVECYISSLDVFLESNTIEIFQAMLGGKDWQEDIRSYISENKYYMIGAPFEVIL